MQRGELNDLLWFLAVAEERSFTRAAARLGTSQSTLSHTIKDLEARLGLRLLTRTTRSVAPTEAGQRLVQSLGPRIEEIEADLANLMALRDKPSGTVRLTLSDHAYRTILWPRLRPVLADYPDLRLEVSIDNVLRNIVEERFDAGVLRGLREGGMGADRSSQRGYRTACLLEGVARGPRHAARPAQAGSALGGVLGLSGADAQRGVGRAG